MDLLRHMKNFCAIIDIANEVNSPEEVNAYYENISFKDLLHIYCQYNGLKDYREEEEEDYKRSYSIDMLTLLEILNKQDHE